MNFYFLILLKIQFTFSSIILDIFDYYGSPNINLILGNSTVLENFDLDMSIDYLWVSSMKYTSESDHTIKLIEKNITLTPSQKLCLTLPNVAPNTNGGLNVHVAASAIIFTDDIEE